MGSVEGALILDSALSNFVPLDKSFYPPGVSVLDWKIALILVPKIQWGGGTQSALSDGIINYELGRAFWGYPWISPRVYSVLHVKLWMKPNNTKDLHPQQPYHKAAVSTGLVTSKASWSGNWIWVLVWFCLWYSWARHVPFIRLSPFLKWRTLGWPLGVGVQNGDPLPKSPCEPLATSKRARGRSVRRQGVEW